MYLFVLILFSLTCKTYFICWNPILIIKHLRGNKGTEPKCLPQLILGLLPEMPASGNLKSRDSLFCPTPYSLLPNVNGPSPASTNRRIPPWEWLRTLYEVLHEVDIFQICNQHFNDKIIFVSD